MAEKPSYEQKLDDVSFEDDPKRYCQAAYEVAKEYNDQLKDDVIDDRAFYDGFDDVLEDRAKNPNVIRSAKYVPEMKTAIDTRLSAVMDRVEEDKELLVRLRLKEGPDTDESMRDIVEQKEEILNEQLRQCEFISRDFRSLFMGGELQPLSVLKIGLDQEYGWIAKRRNILDMGKAAMSYVWDFIFRRGETPKLEWTYYEYDIVREHPYTEWLDWDQFLWDPRGVSSLKECQFVIHRRYVERNELFDMAEKHGYDMSKVNEMIEFNRGTDESHNQTIAEEIDEKVDFPTPDKYMQDGKYLICEFHVRTRDRNNRKTINIAVMGNNNYLLKNDICQFKNVDFPYVVRVAWPKLGKLEGKSSVSIVKPLQRIYNDINNAIMDGATYGIFPPTWVRKGTQFGEQPVWGPGKIIYVDDPQNIVPAVMNLGPIDLLPQLMNMYAAKIRQELNAPDVNQGIDDENDDEKATKTRLRVMGANRRLRPLFSSVEQNIIEVAWLFIKMNQREDPSWIMPIEITVPTLSGAYTPDEELTRAISLYEIAITSPLYNSPQGLFKLRELMADIFTKARVEDIDSRLPTEEELMQMLQIQIQAGQAQAENEAAQLTNNQNNEEQNNASMGTVGQ